MEKHESEVEKEEADIFKTRWRKRESERTRERERTKVLKETSEDVWIRAATEGESHSVSLHVESQIYIQSTLCKLLIGL